MGRDWHEWHRQYDDGSSSLSRRLEDVRLQLATILERTTGPLRLLSLCAGDGRDTVPVVAGSERDVTVTLVELDPVLADRARGAAERAGIDADIRTADAGRSSVWADRVPVDVLMLCGIFGNVSDADVEGTVLAARSMLAPGGFVIWTRGRRVGSGDPSERTGDPAEWVRGLFRSAGFDEIAYVAPDAASYRVGVARLAHPSDTALPEQLFTFVR
jgi:hypothetical protein